MRGALIASVDPMSPAQRRDVPRDALIRTINGAPVRSADEARRLQDEYTSTEHLLLALAGKYAVIVDVNTGAVTSWLQLASTPEVAQRELVEGIADPGEFVEVEIESATSQTLSGVLARPLTPLL